MTAFFRSVSDSFSTTLWRWIEISSFVFSASLWKEKTLRRVSRYTAETGAPEMGRRCFVDSRGVCACDKVPHRQLRQFLPTSTVVCQYSCTVVQLQSTVVVVCGRKKSQALVDWDCNKYYHATVSDTEMPLFIVFGWGGMIGTMSTSAVPTM